MTESLALILAFFNQIYCAMCGWAVGLTYYMLAPQKFSVRNDALRGIITGRPNRTNRGGQVNAMKRALPCLKAKVGCLVEHYARKTFKREIKLWLV